MKIEDVFFKSDGLRLDGNIFYPENKKEKNPAIIILHGSMSQRGRFVDYAKALAKIGYICFIFDMRGHGTSEGDIKKSTIKDFLDDVISAYDYVSSIEKVDKENISAVGSSFGGYIVSMLTKKREIKSIVLRAPADYPDEYFNLANTISDDQETMDWRNNVHKETYAFEALNKFEGKVLIVESENDDKIPKQTITNYISAVNRNNLTHIIIKGAPHTLSQSPELVKEFENILVKWFS